MPDLGFFLDARVWCVVPAGRQGSFCFRFFSLFVTDQCYRSEVKIADRPGLTRRRRLSWRHTHYFEEQTGQIPRRSPEPHREIRKVTMPVPRSQRGGRARLCHLSAGRIETKMTQSSARRVKVFYFHRKAPPI